MALKAEILDARTGDEAKASAAIAAGFGPVVQRQSLEMEKPRSVATGAGLPNDEGTACIPS
ncbi:hypothetical protein [Methylobacterium sp. WL120]|uniref:hypothetical protein n=1 Tax=Methylobacterium sp. WL120 TaxID=2603887 RepID=UPI0011CB3E38|nr:hypothetical protein [Methylobacterium sp. WL120]TXM65981.1 hypothetical protein FV229_13975 [Methylobacterium sp. WL120]